MATDESICSELFRSTLEVNFTIHNSKDSESHEKLESTSVNPPKKERIDVNHNTYSDSITFPSEDYEKVNAYFSENLRFIKFDHKHGALHKTVDGTVTVTLYESTSLIHVQGSAYPNWTKMFREMYPSIIGDNNDESTDMSTVPRIVQETVQVECRDNESTEPKTVSDTIQNESELTAPKTVSDTMHEDPHPIALESDEASLVSSTTRDESNTGLHTSISTLQMPMASTPKFERYVPVSLIESLCEQVSQISNEIKLLKEKQNSHENEKRSIRYVTTGTQTDKEIINSPAKKDERTSPAKKKSDARTNNKNDGQTNNKSTHEKRPVESQGSGGHEQRPKTEDHGNSATTTDTRTDTPLKRTLIIGSSITQNIRRRGLKENSQVRTMSGAGVLDIRQEISSMDLSEISDIIIQVGGNDVSRNRNMDAIKEDFAEIISDVNHRSPNTKVLISEVTPRKTKKGKNVDMSEINRTIKAVCEMYGATLIESSRAIKSVNTRQFRKDNLHLNKKGTRDLLFAYEQYVPILKCAEKVTNGCTYCGEEGHNFKTCRHGGKITCYVCSRSGHKAKHCRSY